MISNQINMQLKDTGRSSNDSSLDEQVPYKQKCVVFFFSFFILQWNLSSLQDSSSYSHEEDEVMITLFCHFILGNSVSPEIHS